MARRPRFNLSTAVVSFLLLGGLALFGWYLTVTVSYLAKTLPAPAPVTSENGEFVVPVAELTTQDDRPFLFAGTVIDRDQRRWDEYRRPIRRFPTALECLNDGARTEDTVDLLDIDWRKPRYLQGLDVCLFRIFTTLGEPERIERWLARHDFKVVGTNRYRKDQERDPPDRYYPVLALEGGWSVDAYQERRPTVIHALTGKSMAKGFTVNVKLNAAGEVSSVRMGRRTK